MCGGYSITQDLDRMARHFGAQAPQVAFLPVARAAPSERLPVILDRSPKEVSFAVWGFKPGWKKTGLLINARKETILEKPTFRRPFLERRCLVLADGFLEWQKTDARSVPYCVRLESREPFAMAGIWEAPAAGQRVPRFVILTVPPNATVATIHDRMPAVLLPEQKDAWLARGAEPEMLLSLLKPLDADRTVMARMGRTTSRKGVK